MTWADSALAGTALFAICHRNQSDVGFTNTTRVPGRRGDSRRHNALNHPNLGNPRLDITRGNFGMVDSVSGARVIQISLRLGF